MHLQTISFLLVMACASSVVESGQVAQERRNARAQWSRRHVHVLRGDRLAKAGDEGGAHLAAADHVEQDAGETDQRGEVVEELQQFGE